MKSTLKLAVSAALTASFLLGTASQSFARAVEEIRGSRLGAGGLDSLPWIAVRYEDTVTDLVGPGLSGDNITCSHCLYQAGRDRL